MAILNFSLLDEDGNAVTLVDRSADNPAIADFTDGGSAAVTLLAGGEAEVLLTVDVVGSMVVGAMSFPEDESAARAGATFTPQLTGKKAVEALSARGVDIAWLTRSWPLGRTPRRDRGATGSDHATPWESLSIALTAPGRKCIVQEGIIRRRDEGDHR
jgi:hypothetical protein